MFCERSKKYLLVPTDREMQDDKEQNAIFERPYKARPNGLTKSQYRPNEFLGDFGIMLERKVELFLNCKLQESNRPLCAGSKQVNLDPLAKEANIIQ